MELVNYCLSTGVVSDGVGEVQLGESRVEMVMSAQHGNCTRSMRWGFEVDMLSGTGGKVHGVCTKGS